MLQPRLLRLPGMAASVAAHLTALTIGLGYAGVRPFDATPVEAITVDLIAPAEVEKETPPRLTPPLEIPDLSTSEEPAAASKPALPQPAPQHPEQQAMPSAASAIAMTNTRPALQPPSAAASPATSPQPLASWRPPDPDLSIKYQVNLGLPRGGDFDTAAFSAAKVSTDDVAKFRERLKTCSILPAPIAPADKVTIRLRASFLPDGTLASAPLLIEASASAKGPLLMQAAIEALAACQPYTVLPADRYSEWKVLDLGFTPRDFLGG